MQCRMSCQVVKWPECMTCLVFAVVWFVIAGVILLFCCGGVVFFTTHFFPLY